MKKTLLVCVFMVCATVAFTNWMKAAREANNIQIQLDFAREQQGIDMKMNRNPKI